MLEFLRKYQKIFFVVIATMVISSFVFFGTFSAFSNGPSREDRIVGKAIDGSNLRLLEISALARFLSSDQADAIVGVKNIVFNLLNDGVIRKDLLGSGVADILVREHFDLLRSDVEQRIQRAKVYRSYEHPDAPFLSAKGVWQRFAPEINQQWSQLQTAEQASPEQFATLSRLYQLQGALPAEWLRRILTMYEQQFNWLKPDQRLRQDDLSLFGFHSLTDWFGANFVDMAAVFIHNAAIAAQEKGYRASLEEAKADLRRNFAEVSQKFQEANVPVMTYKEQLRLLGLDETEAAGLWRKVLLLRRYFADVGNSVFIDKLPYAEVATIANEKATVDLYKLPPSLKMNTSLDLFRLQTYLKAVAFPGTDDPLGFPKSFLSMEKVLKDNPQLVATKYKANVIAVDKREAALRAPLKEVWTFETEEETWSRLKKEFSFLQIHSPKTEAEKLQVLGTLDPVQRSKVDACARRWLVDRHPEWVNEALDAAKGEEKQLVLSDGRIELPFVKSKDPNDAERLGSLFGRILEEPEAALSILSCFASDDAVYRFENIEKVSGPDIKTFQEALQDGSLAQISDKFLEAQFPKARLKLPPEQAAKDFSEVKEELATLLLQDLKKTIQAQTGWIEEDVHFSARRLGVVASQALEALKNNPEDSNWIQNEADDPLIKQFKIERETKQIARTAQEDWMAKEPFILIPDRWSSVHVGIDGNVVFFYLKERQIGREPVLEQISAGKQLLASDVQRILAEKLLAAMKKKQVAVIPSQPEQE